VISDYFIFALKLSHSGLLVCQ